MNPFHALLSLASLTALAGTPDAGTAPKISPFPTEAQCLALGNIKQPLSFEPGEELTYDLDALGAKAGKMVVRTLPLKEGTLPIEIHAETNTFFSKVRKVNGTVTSYLNPKTLRPTHYFEDSMEDSIHRVADVTYRKDRTAKLISTINGAREESILKYGNDISDIGGAVHLMRQLPLREGQRICFDVYGIRRIWRVWGTVQPREHVSLPVGEFEALHLAGESARLDWPEARREVHIWVSDDARRLPLAALGAIDLGAVRATLVSYSRPHERQARAENKGNLKW